MDNPENHSTADLQEKYIAIWIKTVETQMHFNEMSGKSRQLGLTFVAAALGVGVVLLGRGDDFTLAFAFMESSVNLHNGLSL